MCCSVVSNLWGVVRLFYELLERRTPNIRDGVFASTALCEMLERKDYRSSEKVSIHGGVQRSGYRFQKDGVR